MEKNQLDKDKIDLYVMKINKNILSKINYDRLQADYKTEEKSYAKGVLNALHTAAVTAYGTDYLTEDDAEYVLLPSVIQSKATGNLCIGLLEIDLLSSGEHCGTNFLTRFGCVNQSDTEMPDKVRNYLRDMYGSYDYAYTLGIENDIHVDTRHFSHEICKILDTFKNHSFEPEDSKYVIGNVNEAEEQMKQVFDTNIIDFAIQSGLVVEPNDKKNDRNCVHVKNSGGLYLFRHGGAISTLSQSQKVISLLLHRNLWGQQILKVRWK